ncbi:MAG: amidohydrolase 2 [Gemmatimonadetes bacterium]|nr:amidohydrolase 2 [Gemmatimonadota bacterium]
MRVVDAHVHFWDPALRRYPWLDDEPALQRAFLPADFAPLRTGSVHAVVFVQADCDPASSDDEVAWVETLSNADPRVLGIVAHVDMLAEQTRSAALDRLAQRERVVGVRHNIQGHPAGYATDAAFVRGVQQVGARGLTFDLCITGGQLSEVVELVDRCPDTRFVLDHCGKPAIRDDAFATWAKQIERLAGHERVSCKLSGLLTEARSDQRSVGGLRLYAEHVVRCFGPERVLYGSDWPVATLSGGAEVWRVITDELSAAWSEADRRAFYADNALRFYGLELPSRV